MLIQGKILSYGADLSEAFEIRRQVLINELQKNEAEVFDDQDSYAMHVIVYEQGNGCNPVATGRITFDGSACEIDQIAVLKEYREKKYGDFTVRMLINKAFTSGIHEVSVRTPIHLVDFFRKIGFNMKNEENLKELKKECSMVIRDGDVLTCCNQKK